MQKGSGCGARSKDGVPYEGEATVTFSIDVDPVSGHAIIPGLSTPIDPTRPSYGYLFVIGPDGGDFHSDMISAFNPDARLTKTCPGNPPTVTKEGFEAGFLLHIIWEKICMKRTTWS
jgi:hypothetical protein